MRWLVDNWSFLVVIACAMGAAYVYVKKFAEKPTEEQLARIREWLLYAVIEAEKEFGGGTGVLKLHAVYNDFCQVFPQVAQLITFELFSKLVDEALDEMKKILQYNKDIQDYVKGEVGW